MEAFLDMEEEGSYRDKFKETINVLVVSMQVLDNACHVKIAMNINYRPH
jgi:hypothetical protein